MPSIRKYQLFECIGSGAYGDVHRAWDPDFGREVAVKLLKPSFSKQKNWVARFKREAQLLWKVRSPYVLEVYDVGEENGVHFIVTELLKGETLREVLQRRGRFSHKEAIEIAMQAAQGIQAVHDAGILLRDVKPENLFLTTNGTVKVLDFGLAKFDGRTTGTLIESTSTDWFGTVQYMSPEQLRRKPLDRRTDVFSLMVAVYEMIGGRRPWADRPDERRAVLRGEKPTPLSELCATVPVELADVIHKGLEKQPWRRFGSMKELLTALECVTREQVVTRKLPADSKADHRPVKRAHFSIGPVTAARGLQIAALALLFSFLAFGAAALTGVLNSVKRPPVEVPKKDPAEPTVQTKPSRRQAGGDAGTPKRLAILPFANARNERELRYLADGIPDALIRTLSRESDIGVTSWSSVYRYRGHVAAPSEVAADLGVSAIVEGTLAMDDHGLRLKIQLSTAENKVAWNRDYTCRLTELAALEARMARDIGNHFQIELDSEVTINGRAYIEFLRGRYHFNLRRVDDLYEAIRFYRKALQIDPHYALAYAGVAECYVMLGSSGYAARQPDEAMALALEAATKAIENGPNLPEGHTSLALVLLRYKWDWSGAEREFLEAIRLDSGYAPAHLWYATLLAAERRPEAFAEIKLARELEPDSAIIEATAGQVAYFARDYAKAISTLNAVLQSKADFYPALALLGFVYEAGGEFEKAIRLFEDADPQVRNNPVIIGSLGYANARAGKTFEAMQKLRELRQLGEFHPQTHYIPAYAIATIYVGLGKKDEAFMWLERAVEERSSWLMYLGVEPLLDSLRSDPRFENLVQRVGLSERLRSNVIPGQSQ